MPQARRAPRRGRRAGRRAARRGLDGLDRTDERRAALAAARATAEAAATAAATALTAARATAARTLEREVQAALVELGMGAARLAIAIEPRPMGATGADLVELLLGANKGEDARPLAKIASRWAASCPGSCSR